jgi:hypothetical protein
MPHLINYGKEKLSDESMPLFILMEGGIFQDLKNKNMRVNFKAFSQSKPTRAPKTSIELHVELVKKIDALLEKVEREKGSIERQTTMEWQETKMVKPHVELRTTLDKKPILPFSETSYHFSQPKLDSDVFEIEKPPASSVHPNSYSPLIQSERTRITRHLPTLTLDAETLDIKDASIATKPYEPEPLLQGSFRVKLKEKELKNTLFYEAGSNQETDKNTRSMASASQKQRNTFSSLLKAKKNLQKSKQELEERKKQLNVEEKKAKQQAKELKRKEQDQRKSVSDETTPEKKEDSSQQLDEKKSDTRTKHQEKPLRKRPLPEVKIRKLEERKAFREMKRKKKELHRNKKQGAVFAASLKKTSDNTEEQKIKKETEETPSNKNLFEIERPPEITTEIKDTKEEKSDEIPPFTLEEEPSLDEDVRKVLKIADDLLEKLPEDVIDKFATSDDFALYEKVITKYKIK